MHESSIKVISSNINFSTQRNVESVAEGQEYPPVLDQNWIESTEKKAQSKVLTCLCHYGNSQFYDLSIRALLRGHHLSYFTVKAKLIGMALDFDVSCNGRHWIDRVVFPCHYNTKLPSCL